MEEERHVPLVGDLVAHLSLIIMFSQFFMIMVIILMMRRYDGPYPGQAVWLLAHCGPHVKDHHIDLKVIAQKMHLTSN